MPISRPLLLAILTLSLPLCAQAPRTDRLDLHHLPLGDGLVSDHAQSGYVFSG